MRKTKRQYIKVKIRGTEFAYDSKACQRHDSRYGRTPQTYLAGRKSCGRIIGSPRLPATTPFRTRARLEGLKSGM